MQAPFRSRAELEAAIQLLQAERIRLLSRYTEQQPEIRDLDRRLAILDRQMKMLAQPWPACMATTKKEGGRPPPFSLRKLTPPEPSPS